MILVTPLLKPQFVCQEISLPRPLEWITEGQQQVFLSGGGLQGKQKNLDWTFGFWVALANKNHESIRT